MTPTCAQSLDVPTITPPTLSDKAYIWTQAAGSYGIPFTLTSSLSFCTVTDIVVTLSVTGSVSGSTSFLTFNQATMLMSWIESSIRIAETFTVTLTATITN